MKTIIKSYGSLRAPDIIRVSDERAAEDVKTYGWKYCPKYLLKEKLREQKAETEKKA